MLRKLCCALLAALMLAGGAPCGSRSLTLAHAAGASIELVDQGDLKIELTGAELNEHDDGDALRLYATVENDTGEEIDIHVRDAYLDGTEVKGYGIYNVEAGARTDDFFMFKALEGESDAPLYDPGQYVFNLEVKNGDRELLYFVPVHISSALPMGTDTPEKTARPTARPTATPADEEIPLEFFQGGYIEWKDLDDDWFQVRVQVRNNSYDRTIKAFEIYMYATDVYGDRIYGDDWVYYETTKRTVEPRDIVYSEYFQVPRRSEVDRVYFGLHRIVYSDGTVAEASRIDYWYWTMD